MPMPSETVDLVYARQVLHHASDLPAMVAECARVLRPGGVLLSLRDHVAETPEEREDFLAKHPVHSAIGGENAYPLAAYVDAVQRAGLHVERILGPLDSLALRLTTSPSHRRLRAWPFTARRWARDGAASKEAAPSLFTSRARGSLLSLSRVAT
jgi:SAM-dependent methyltransferase